MSGARRSSLAVLGVVVLATGLPAQERSLAKPEARYARSFDMIAGVRELPDGRVLVSDGIAETVMAVDLSTGKAETLGRPGRGPGEYQLPDALFPLPGGRTLLVDLGNARLTTIEPNGRLGESETMASEAPEGFAIVIPRGTDARGRIYHQPMGSPMAGGVPDSGAVVRLDREAGTSDTAAMVKLAALNVDASGEPGNRNVMARPVPYAPQDAWAVAPDGSVAVARALPYRVDWYRHDGSVVRGPVLEVRPVPIRAAEKQEWIEALSGGLSVMVSVENGRRDIQFGRGGRGDEPDPDAFEWPASKPPFSDRAVSVTPEGEAWVRRSVPAGAPARYDVFAADGARTAEVVLGKGRRVVGFGSGTVYVAETDEDGLQWLERYER